MRVLAAVALFSVIVHSATIYDALKASSQFTNIKDLVDRVPQLKNILSDPNTQVTFFAPSDNALTNVPFERPFRYLFPGVIDVSNMKAGTQYNYRGEKIAFDVDNTFINMRTEYVFLPGTDAKYQPRILRAPLRKEDGLLENGNLYYIDRQIYTCAELTYRDCIAIADDQCREKCNEQHITVQGTNVINNYPNLRYQFNPPNPLPPFIPDRPEVVVDGAKPPAAAPGGPPGSVAAPKLDLDKTNELLDDYPYDTTVVDDKPAPPAASPGTTVQDDLVEVDNIGAYYYNNYYGISGYAYGR